MAFVVPTKQGRFEIRESHSTPAGPRSRTLASFTELTDEVIEKARDKSAKPPSADELRRAARRAGAPVVRSPADRAAGELLAELAMGRGIEPRRRQLLLGALEDGWAEPTAAPSTVRSAAEWMAATSKQRAKVLVDLLLLADALPHGGRKGKPLRFPKLNSSSA